MEKDIRQISRSKITIKHEPTPEDMKISALIRIADVLEGLTIGKLALFAENIELKDQLNEANKKANLYQLKFQKSEQRVSYLKNKHNRVSIINN